MSESGLPTAIHEGELTICGVKLRTYVLDDGRRIINADDVHALLAAWASGAEMSAEDGDALAKAIRGIP